MNRPNTYPSPLSMACWLSLVLVGGCGVNVGNPSDEEEDGDKKAFEQTEAKIELITTQYDEGMYALTDPLSFIQARDSGNPPPPPRLRTSLTSADESEASCESKEGVVTATVAISEAINHDLYRRDKYVHIEKSRSGNVQSNWKSTPNAVACDEAKEKAEVNWSVFENIEFLHEFDLNSSHSIRDLDKDTILRSGSFGRKGNQEITITKTDSNDDGSFKAEQTVKFKTSHSRVSLKRDNHEPLAFTSEIESEENSLIKVEGEYSSDGDWTKLTIKSGTIVLIHDDGTVLKSHYADLTFSKDGGCLPSKGTVKGEVYRRISDKKAHETFIVEFGEDAPMVTFASGEVHKIEPDECPFSKRNKGGKVAK